MKLEVKFLCKLKSSYISFHKRCSCVLVFLRGGSPRSKLPPVCVCRLLKNIEDENLLCTWVVGFFFFCWRCRYVALTFWNSRAAAVWTCCCVVLLSTVCWTCCYVGRSSWTRDFFLPAPCDPILTGQSQCRQLHQLPRHGALLFVGLYMLF